jgi:hypothetical protein
MGEDTNHHMSLDSQKFQKQGIINDIQHENVWLRDELSNAKQRYKELFESIKITRDQNNKKVTSLLNEIENLKTMVKGKMPVGSCDHACNNVYVCSKYFCDAVEVSLPLRNNKLVHSNYLRHLKECLVILRETIEEDRITKPLDEVVVDVCFLSNRAQELLEYAISTCPKNDNKLQRLYATQSNDRNKHATVDIPQTLPHSNVMITNKQTTTKLTNVPIIASTGVKGVFEASGPQPRCNTKNDRALPAKSALKNKVEESSRNNKKHLVNEKNRVDSNICLNNDVIDSNSYAICKTCNECLIVGNHDACVVPLFEPPVQSSVKNVLNDNHDRQVWKCTGKVFTNVGYQWMPTGRKFSLGEKCPLTRLTNSKIVPVKKWIPTGRTFPFEARRTTSRSSASLNTDTNGISVTYDNPVFVCANLTNPNGLWGSSSVNYPPLSGFKCRSYKSSFGIWTQAAQNI